MRPASLALTAAAFAGLLAACTLSSEGIAPPQHCDRGGTLPGEDPSNACHMLHYPVAAVLDPSGNFLYVVDSDFNLEYNGGRVWVVNVGHLLDGLGARADATGPRWHAQRGPGNNFEGNADLNLINFNDPGSSVILNPFATAAGLSADGTRLYVTVRGDGTLTWIDIVRDSAHPDAPPRLTCANDASGMPIFGGECDAAHRRGNDPTQASPRGLTLPPLPDALSVDRDGLIVTAHQEYPSARAALFYDATDMSCAVGSAGPQLLHWVGGLSPNLDAVVRADWPPPTCGRPMPSTASGPSPHWYLLSRTEPVMNHVEAFIPDPSAMNTAFLYKSAGVPLMNVTSDVGIRAMILDPCDPDRAYATARPATNPTIGLTPQTQVPTTTTVALSPEQIISFNITDRNNPTVQDIMPLPQGVSNLTIVPPPVNPDPTLSTFAPQTGTCNTAPRIYTVSYTSNKLYVIDAHAWQELDEINTQRGPQVPVFDSVHYVMYVVDFAAMVIEIVDVLPGSPTYDQVVSSIGIPVPPVLM